MQNTWYNTIMYNSTKFNYHSMNRELVDGHRHYVTPDGAKLPSVTTILSATKPAEKTKALMEWKRRMGEKKAQSITTEAANRGTRMHKFLEDYVKTGDAGRIGSNPFSKQSYDMAQIIINKGLVNCNEYWGVEIGLYYPSMYAGTTDLVGVHDGSPAIMDFKQTNKPKKREWIEDYFLQLAAYSSAHDAVYGTKIRKGVIFMCSADNQYQEFIIEGNEFEEWTDRWFSRVEQYYSQFL